MPTPHPYARAALVAVILTAVIVGLVLLVPDPTPAERLVSILEAVRPHTLTVALEPVPGGR